MIEIRTLIHAPPARCFDLARSVDLHTVSTSATGERAIAGRTSGLMELGDVVTWRARHFGIWQNLTSRITAFERPHHFRDSMVSGAFARFDHDHVFQLEGAGTLMIDRFDYDAPLGLFGRFAETFVLNAYMRHFLKERCAVVKRVAESGEWRQYLSG